MNKEQHIRDMLRAEFDGETIMYTGEGDRVVCESNGFNPETGNMKQLLDHPERYSIKKEPQLIYENVYRHIEDEDEDEDEVRFYTYTYSKKASALKAAEEFPDRLVLAAHPIALPEAT